MQKTSSDAPDKARTILFSGHMIDAPAREKPRFPPSMEEPVRRAIQRQLAALSANGADTGICSAACGSDILFAELALERDVPLRIFLPFDVDAFLDASVRFANER